jgi:thiamine-monophosphate kinase
MKPTENEVVRKLLQAMHLPRPTAGLALGPGGNLSLGPGDDAALLTARRGYQSILTCDWFLEGTHFLRDKHPADSIGWKCLARAVSDVAAMGGRPRCFLLSLALPVSCTDRWLVDFVGGLRRASAKLGCPLAGGDTTRRNEILINITVVGEVRTGRALTRSGALSGDAIFVSGRLGEAERGLQLLRQMRQPRVNDPALRKHLYPEPRLALGQWLSEHRMATAMMDLSDGLSTDLPRLCVASGVGARIQAARVPTALPIAHANSGKGSRSKAVQRNPSELAWNSKAIDLALNGGDDYELLFTVRPGKARHLPARIGRIPITRIGEVTRERKLLLAHADGSEQSLKEGGWNPFAAKSR